MTAALGRLIASGEWAATAATAARTAANALHKKGKRREGKKKKHRCSEGQSQLVVVGRFGEGG